MAIEAYVTIRGKVQGPFRGNDKRGLGAKSLEFSYQVEAPRDIATGHLSGKRQHKPITVVKEWGASSPQLFHALVSNEVLDSVVFEFVDQSASPQDTSSKLQLKNAIVSHMRHIGGGKYEVSFVYEEISVSGDTPRF